MADPFLAEEIVASGSMTSQKISVLESGAVVKGQQKNEKDVEINYGKGVILYSPNGNRWRIGVTNLGQLMVTNLDA